MRASAIAQACLIMKPVIAATDATASHLDASSAETTRQQGGRSTRAGMLEEAEIHRIYSRIADSQVQHQKGPCHQPDTQRQQDRSSRPSSQTDLIKQGSKLLLLEPPKGCVASRSTRRKQITEGCGRRLDRQKVLFFFFFFFRPSVAVPAECSLEVSTPQAAT